MHNVIPDQLTNLPPLFMIGAMVGRAELLLDQIPNVVKLMAITISCVAAFYSIKTDIAVLDVKMSHAAQERGTFSMFMQSSDHCTLGTCNEMSNRLSNLEGLHRK